MRHNWIHSVLQDIDQYAKMNHLKDLHRALEEPIRVSQLVASASEEIFDNVSPMKDVDRENVVVINACFARDPS